MSRVRQPVGALRPEGGLAGHWFRNGTAPSPKLLTSVKVYVSPPRFVATNDWPTTICS